MTIHGVRKLLQINTIDNVVVLTALYSFILKGTQRGNKVTGRQDARFDSSTFRPHFTPKKIPWYAFLFAIERPKAAKCG